MNTVSETTTKIGKKIRKERKKRQLTLAQLSELTGLSKSFLSQLERGLTEPSISSLKKISKQFGLSVVNLFMDGNEQDPNWEYNNSPIENGSSKPVYIKKTEVVRVDKRKRLALPGSNVIYDLLTPDMKRKLEVMYMRVSKGDTSGPEPMLDISGEKMAIILKGTLELTIGDDVFILNEGDSLYYSTDNPHSWRALDGDTIEVIWVLTPPSF